MRDRLDRVVGGVLGAAVLACIIAAVAIRPTPLSTADARRWIAIAGDRAASTHLLHRTFSLDEVDVGPARTPYAGQTASVPRGANFVVSGWALDPQRRSSTRVVFRVDRGPWRSARVRLPRPDVATALELPGAADSGFAAIAPTGALAPGEHELELATVGARGPQPIPERAHFTVVAR
jgi:hypothetical protein